MQFTIPSAQVYAPDGLAPEDALARTTHIAVGAHQDDLEIMAFSAIHACFQRDDRWFAGVVLCDGAGSPREGRYRDYTDADMAAVRRREQRKAAEGGENGALVALDFPSAALKDPAHPGPVGDLAAIFEAAQPQVAYIHNLIDKHPTHVAAALRTIAALRLLPRDKRPQKLYGCEVWRDLDWMRDEDKTAFDVSGAEHLQAALLGVFDSQIGGGKRYDLACLGRRRAHATFQASHGVDAATGLALAMDLTPLLEDDALDPAAYALAYIDRFRADAARRLEEFA